MASRYEVEVKLVSAANLKNVNWRNGPNHPYVVVWVDPSQKYSTQADKIGDTQPKWDETVVIPLPPSATMEDSTLYIDVLHALLGSNADAKPIMIGSTKLGLEDVWNEGCTYHRVNRSLTLKRPSGRPQGTVDVKVLIRDNVYPPQQGVSPLSLPRSSNMSSVYHAPPIYSAPPPIHSAPPPIQSAPLATQSTPLAMHSAPLRMHSAPLPMHSAPFSIHTPLPNHSAPLSIHSAPFPMHSAPFPMHSTPFPMHSAPFPSSYAYGAALYGQTNYGYGQGGQQSYGYGQGGQQSYGYGSRLEAQAEEKKGKLGMGAGLAVGALAGGLGALALGKGVDMLEDNVADRVADKVEESDD